MNLYINSKLNNVPDEINNVARLLQYLHIPENGTGVSLNGKLVKAKDRSITYLKDEDSLLIISATFGG